MAIESRMSLILSWIDIVRPELCAHVRRSLPLVSSGNLVNTNPKSLIGPVSHVSSELRALEFEKKAIFDFVNTLAPSFLHQS